MTRAKTFERARRAARRRAADAPDPRLRPRQLTAPVHARGRRRKDDPDDDDQRDAGDREHAGARDVVIASYVNYTAVLTMLRTALRGGTDITLVCAGRDRQFALEDAGCAGRFVYNVSKRLTGVVLNDAAQACALIDRKYGDQIVRLFEASEHGRALRDAGFADDLTACAAVDSYPVIPLYQDRQITKLGPDRER